MEREVTGRLFAAVVPPGEVVAALDDWLGRFDLPGQPVPAANWHVTLRFVGPIDRVSYERWIGAIDQADKPEPFEMTLGGIGAFPRPARATVLWVGCESDRLAELAESVDGAADMAGLGREERPFRPHLTIARVRPPEDVTALTSADGWRARFVVREFHVMAAVGSRYRRFETFEL